jgi:hypothetical protein
VLDRVNPSNYQQQLADTIERQRKELRHLRRSQEALTKKVDALEKRAKSWLGVVDDLKELPQQRQTLQSQVSSMRFQQVTGVVGNIQAAAFGDSGSFFTRNNLLLAGNQLFWLFLDPVLRRVGVIGGTSPSAVAWLAPLGSLMTGQLALANQQHERFVSGVTKVTPGRVSFEVLRDRIADGFWETFQRRSAVPVTAAVVDTAPFIAAADVREGVLRVTVTEVFVNDIVGPSGGSPIDPPTPVRVAWVIDTGAGNG